MNRSQNSSKFTPDGEEDPNVYPPGWNYEKTQRVAEFFDREASGEVIVDPEGPLLEYELNTSLTRSFSSRCRPS